MFKAFYCLFKKNCCDLAVDYCGKAVESVNSLIKNPKLIDIKKVHVLAVVLQEFFSDLALNKIVVNEVRLF